MKRITKYILRVLFILVMLFLSYKVANLRLYKLLLNQARIIQKSEAAIFGDEKRLENSYVFKYTDDSSEKIILYLQNSDAYAGRNIIMIDVKNNQIGVPNSNIRDYSRWGSYIFQNDSGEKFIPFNSSDKRQYFDSNLEVNNNILSFHLPKGGGYPFASITIEF